MGPEIILFKTQLTQSAFTSQAEYSNGEGDPVIVQTDRQIAAPTMAEGDPIDENSTEQNASPAMISYATAALSFTFITLPSKMLSGVTILLAYLFRALTYLLTEMEALCTQQTMAESNTPESATRPKALSL